jgi:hypothetical protein
MFKQIEEAEVREGNRFDSDRSDSELSFVQQHSSRSFNQP